MTALYNKYRPANLSEVVGQEHVTVPLSVALDKGQLHHAYLLSGPRGCGKTSTSRILAKSLNCEQGPTSKPCDKCNSCREISDGRSLDVSEIDAASEGGVEDARKLRQRAATKPSTSRYRIFIIDEAHMVTTAGFNALLKVVEEPPAHLKFIFATTEPEKVIGTIKSRTFQYPFRLVNSNVMTQYLEKIVALEGVDVDPAAYPLIVRSGGGSVRDTLSTLDQLLQGAHAKLTVEDAVNLLGLTDSTLLGQTVDAVLTRDATALFGLVDKVANAGLDPRRFANDTLERLRDILILKSVPGAESKGILGALTEAELTQMREQANSGSISDITRASAIFNSALLDMRNAAKPRLALELAIAQLVSGEDERLARLEKMVSELGQRLQNGDKRRSAGAVAAPEPQAQPPAVEDEPHNEEPAPPLETLPKKPENPASWEQVVKAAAAESKAAAALLGQYAKVLKLQDGEAIIEFPHAGMLKAFEGHRSAAVNALNQALGGDWKLITEAAQ